MRADDLYWDYIRLWNHVLDAEDGLRGMDGWETLTVNRTRRDGRGWRDGITWDELQRVKNETIGPKFWCAEAYPPEDRVVNVANMRHLWVLEEPGHIGAVAFPTESFWKKGL